MADLPYKSDSDSESPKGITHPPPSFEDMLTGMQYKDMLDHRHITPADFSIIQPMLEIIMRILQDKTILRYEPLLDMRPRVLAFTLCENFFRNDQTMYTKLLIVLQPFQRNDSEVGEDHDKIKINDLFPLTFEEIMPLLNAKYLEIMANRVPVQIYEQSSDGSASVVRSDDSAVREWQPSTSVAQSSVSSVAQSSVARLFEDVEDQVDVEHLDVLRNTEVPRLVSAASSSDSDETENMDMDEPETSISRSTEEARRSAEMRSLPPPILVGVSYLILIHGGSLNGDKIAYKMDHSIRHRISYVAVDQVSPTVETIPGHWIGARDLLESTNPISSEFLHFIRDSNPNPNLHCESDESSVLLQPLVFKLNAEFDRRVKLNELIGIWRFDFWSNQQFSKVCLINWDALLLTHHLDKAVSTYMFLFGIIFKDLKSIKQVHPAFDDSRHANIRLFCCRTRVANRVLASEPFLTPNILDRAHEFSGQHVDYLRLPTGAHICVGPTNSLPFMTAIPNASLNEAMRPMLTFEVHVTSQGCLYNLLSYYGIITETDGNILTAMQSEGVTVLQFINLMNKHDILLGRRPHKYMVVRELFNRAIVALTHFLGIIEFQSRALLEEDLYTYAVFIKLYPLNYKPNTSEHSEIGHWVSISYSRAHGWRFVDPQFLSCSTTGELRTVPRTHVASSLEHVLSMIQPVYQAIDFILIEPCSSREPPHCLNPLCSDVFKKYIGVGATSRDLRGGKTRKLRLKSKSRRKPKPHNKTRTRFNKSRPGSSSDSDSDGGGMRRRVMSKKRKFKSKMKTRTNRRAVK